MAIINDIYIYIDAAEAVEYAKKKLGKLQGGKARMAVRTAINKTAKEVKKYDERGAKKTFTDKGDLNALKYTSATTGNLQAILRDKGGSVPITHFRWRNGKTVVSALINRNNGYKKMIFNGNKAFYATNLRRGGETVVVRQGAARLPITKVKSLSSPSAHGAPDVWEKDVQAKGEAKFYENLDAEIARILNLL